MKTTETLTVELRADGPELPTEFPLFQAGITETKKGPFLMDTIAQARVLAAFEGHGLDRLPIDFDHASTKADARAGDGKAAGWFVPAVRDGALWATSVQWTSEAAKLLSDRAYRFHSPTFYAEPAELDGKTVRRVVELLCTALTNLPATRNQRPLVLAETEPEGTPAALALSEALKIQAAEVESLKAQLAARDRVELHGLIDDAIDAAKFTPGQREHLQALAAKAPAETRALLAASLPSPELLRLSTPVRELPDTPEADPEAKRIAEALGVES